MSVVAYNRASISAAFAPEFAAEGPVWLKARRTAAMKAFERTGIPNRRVEAWKYTDLQQAMDEGLVPASPYAGKVEGYEPFAKRAASRIVFTNGFVQATEAGDGIEIVNVTASEFVPEWVRKEFGTQAAGADQPLGAAALALMQTGVAIRVKGKDRTLHLDFQNLASEHDWAGHTRVLLIMDAGASLRLFESHTGDAGKSFLNLGLELVLTDGAQVEHIRLHKGGEKGIEVASLGGTIAKNARYRALFVSLGGKLLRVDANLRLTGDGASAIVNNVAVAHDGIHDTTTVMDHAHPRTQSRQLFKSVVGAGGRSVSQGRVTVREGAVKSDSHQLFKALLLSPRAEADAKPELEIFADDVTCGHGTAIGAVDADAMFYLRARGIPELEARALLVRAFLDEALEPFGDEELRADLRNEIDKGLSLIGDAA
jgi:Fe-S cluster assembly protein SufD